MPIGIQRLNTKKSRPNERIVFIEPLKGPDEAIARDFLERIAAQCLPIMREHHLSVMSLEEYEPNPEFVGRNFNAGEVIQLVLRTRFTGRWLPFDYVQMVMMHELAHCKQMNHSRAFWALRNAYAEQMGALRARHYTGDGLWGRGTLLESGAFTQNTVLPDERLPEHLCGGTWRARRRKRKGRKQELRFQDKKKRRILKKFGANGVALGEDREMKRRLEKGKSVAARPRVAGSARGRELRAAAALARFEEGKMTVKKETDAREEELSETASGDEMKVKDLKEEELSETASEDEQDEEQDAEARDIEGMDMLDSKGREMVRVCGDEDSGEEGAQEEMRELQSWVRRPPRETGRKRQMDRMTSETHPTPDMHSITGASTSVFEAPSGGPSSRPANQDETTTKVPLKEGSRGRACLQCTFANEPLAVTCTICGNVLNPLMTRSWTCTGGSCKGLGYWNSSDCASCGVCGQKKKPMLCYQTK